MRFPVPEPSPPATPLRTAREAAQYLRISERHLWTITKEGRLRSIRIDRCVRYRPADLDAFIESCRTDAKGA
jgi:excisionase family DNA binding protein